MTARTTRPILFLFALLQACGGGNDQPATTTDTIDISDGQSAVASLLDGNGHVETAPFRLCFNGQVCTARAQDLPPSPYLYVEGARPRITPGTMAAFPAFGWVVGTTENRVFPSFIWQGNRLAGRDRGTFYAVTSVADIREHKGRTEIALNTNFPGAKPALLTLEKTVSGALKVHLQPPAAIREAGIAVTLLTIDSPEDEGLFGLGARKDVFNQRGKLRNVWTEQQNTGTGGLADLDFAGAGLPMGLPTSDLLDWLAINPDLDDPILNQSRTTFPNGAQAAYWVEAFVVGSRGWTAWTTQTQFQRLDLAASRSDKLRWQIVGSDEMTLLFADGGIEQASRTYTDYWGRSPKPNRNIYYPWIDTLNQGEGEAAPNGQGFWGGERARCDLLEFVAKSREYDLPFKMLGIEGWQVVPRGHPDIQTTSDAKICAEVAVDAESYAADPIHFAPGTNANGEDFFDYLIKDQGFRLAGYWNFFTTDPQCETTDEGAAACQASPDVPLASKHAFYEARDNGYFVKNAETGEDQQVTTNRGGVSRILDFTNPEVFPYWERQIARLLDLGIDTFMHDFGELTTDEMRFAAGQDLIELHNHYALAYQSAGRQAVNAYMQRHEGELRDDFQPFFYARAGMTGACAQTPGVFPGDESTSWDAGHGLPSVVPAMLNLSLSGCYLFTTDIGGYFDFTAPRTREDLFIRWSQLAALTPIMRIHNSTFNGSVFPWTWHEGNHEDPEQYDAVSIFRRYARLKINLIPLVTHWVARAATRGDIGPVRPLILEDTSEEAMAVDYQWLLGEDLLVAPVIEKKASYQQVYFPRGAHWQRVTVDDQGQLNGTGETYRGGQGATVSLRADLHNIPLFVRCNSTSRLLPLARPFPACDTD